MSTKWVCPFCGSPQLHIQTPFVTRTLDGGSAPQKTYCCLAQKKNAQFEDHRRLPDIADLEKLEDVCP